VIGACCLALVALWLVASAMYQVERFRRPLSRVDSLELLPSWSFFAPHPASRDSHIVVQDLLADGTLSGWTTVTRIPARRPVDAVWHPSKRARKILRDAAKAVQRTRRAAASEGVVQCSLAYLVILHYCMQSSPPDATARARQFAVVETSGRDERRMWVTFISIFHQLAK
jgi:hypothetical protein